EVIRNRMNTKYASDGTVSGTVLRPKQFSGWNTTDPSRIRTVRSDTNDDIVKQCLQAWEEAKQGSNRVRGAVLYLNPGYLQKNGEPMPDWALPDSADEVAIVGQHHFFVP